MERRSKEEYDKQQDIVGSGKWDGGGVIKRAVVGAVVGGPLLAGMGITLALTVSVGVVGIPLMLIFSPLLIIPCFILGTAIAGFSVAALLALAGISTLNSVFRSIRHHSYDHLIADEEEEEEENEEGGDDKDKGEGWNKWDHQQEKVGKEEKDATTTPPPPPPQIEEEDTAADEDENKHAEDADAGQGDEETKVTPPTTSLEQHKEKDHTIAPPSQTPPVSTSAATPTSTTTPKSTPTPTPTDTDTSQKKQPPQKSKKQKPKQ